jgi:hypothetical protein
LTATEFIKRRVEADLRSERLGTSLQAAHGQGWFHRSPTKQNTFSIRRGLRIFLLVAHISLVPLEQSTPLRAAARVVAPLYEEVILLNSSLIFNTNMELYLCERLDVLSFICGLRSMSLQYVFAVYPSQANEARISW